MITRKSQIIWKLSNMVLIHQLKKKSQWKLKTMLNWITTENSFKYNFPFEGEDLVVVCKVNSGGKSLSRDPGQEINARIPEGIWAGGLGRGEKRRNPLRLPQPWLLSPAFQCLAYSWHLVSAYPMRYSYRRLLGGKLKSLGTVLCFH